VCSPLATKQGELRLGHRAEKVPPSEAHWTNLKAFLDATVLMGLALVASAGYRYRLSRPARPANRPPTPVEKSDCGKAEDPISCSSLESMTPSTLAGVLLRLP
jgi:hypothetical protein